MEIYICIAAMKPPDGNILIL